MKERFGIIEDHVNAEHWQRDLSATEMYADSAATSATKTKINGIEVLNLPDSAAPANPVVSWGILRPDYALDGIWRVRFWYSHSASGQAAVCTLTGRAIDTDTGLIGVTGAPAVALGVPDYEFVNDAGLGFGGWKQRPLVMPAFNFGGCGQYPQSLTQHPAVGPEPAAFPDFSPDGFASVDLVHAAENHLAEIVAGPA